METKNINDSDEGSSEKHGFHAILHHDVHERLMAFPSMLCHCIFKNNFCIMIPCRLELPQWST